MSDRVTREVKEKLGDGSERTFVCWEDGEARGFYEKGSPSDPEINESGKEK